MSACAGRSHRRCLDLEPPEPELAAGLPDRPTPVRTHGPGRRGLLSVQPGLDEPPAGSLPGLRLEAGELSTYALGVKRTVTIDVSYPQGVGVAPGG